MRRRLILIFQVFFFQSRRNKDSVFLGGESTFPFEPRRNIIIIVGSAGTKDPGRFLFRELDYSLPEKKEHHGVNKTAFESHSNGESQSAFHLNKDPYIALRRYVRRGKGVRSKTEILHRWMLNFIHFCTACKCVSEVRGSQRWSERAAIKRHRSSDTHTL